VRAQVDRRVKAREGPDAADQLVAFGRPDLPPVGRRDPFWLALVEGADLVAELRYADDGRVGVALRERPRSAFPRAEAIGGALYALFYDHVKIKGPERLAELVPWAVYVTLTPFIGAEEAYAVATGSEGNGEAG
jgi:hypothetical protein